MSSAADVPYGTLDLMVLKTLQTLGPQHGFGVARRIEQMARGILSLNQGTIYPALLRLEQQGLISAEWSQTETGRDAKFYELTKTGRAALKSETAQWERLSAAVGLVLRNA